MPTFEPDSLSPRDLYHLLISAVEPRPIAFVSTRSPSGIPNLAPFSFFTIASVAPPVLAFTPLLSRPASADDTEGRQKDTLRNLSETGECVVHVVSFDMKDAMNRASASWPPEVDEFVESGLTPVLSTMVQPPRVEEAHVAFECRVQQIVSFGDTPMSGNLVLCRVLAVHVSDDALQKGRISREVLDPIGRLGGLSYVRVNEATFDLPRPSVDSESGSKR
jgi:flavin reductase (DIM6/NTAB) family NADH-FMN oxidoreductase RutF